MTDRELLALAVIAAPALTAFAAAVAPRRFVTAVAVGGALLSGAAAAALAIVALASPASPLVGRWLVVDAPLGCSSA